MSNEADNNEQEQQETAPEENSSLSLLQSINRNAVLLGLFALVCTAVIALTFLGTEDEIELRIKEARSKALLEIVPASKHDNDMLQDTIALFDEALGHRGEQHLFLAKQGGKPYALIYPATARDGYSGDINYIVGIDIANRAVAGVRVLSHKETPGLGDKVDLRKSNWILDFNGRSLTNPTRDKWTVKKDGGDFDGFTGATITPRALVNSVASVLEYHNDNAIELLKQFEQ